MSTESCGAACIVPDVVENVFSLRNTYSYAETVNSENCSYLLCEIFSLVCS